MKSQLTEKDPDAGKDWGQEAKGTTEDEMVGWYHWLNGHEFEQTLGDGEGQGSLVCCSPWGLKESDMTARLNNRLGVAGPRSQQRWQFSPYLTSISAISFLKWRTVKAVAHTDLWAPGRKSLLNLVSHTCNRCAEQRQLKESMFIRCDLKYC